MFLSTDHGCYRSRIQDEGPHVAVQGLDTRVDPAVVEYDPHLVRRDTPCAFRRVADEIKSLV